MASEPMSDERWRVLKGWVEPCPGWAGSERREIAAEMDRLREENKEAYRRGCSEWEDVAMDWREALLKCQAFAKKLQEENAALKASNVLRGLTELFEEGIDVDIDAMTDEEISAECELHGFNTEEVVRRVKEALKTAKEKADGE
jgi:translation initiation factor 2 alpha subunit (eIF-2alpha)